MDKHAQMDLRTLVAQELKKLGEMEVVIEEQAAPSEQEREDGQVSYDIPITINDQVEYFVNYFQNKISKRFGLWMARSGRYIPMMRSILKEYGLPEDLVYLSMIESGFSCRAYSTAHAVGPWQFIRGTGRRYGLKINYWVDERRDPVKSTYAAAKYLQALYKEFGSWYLAAAAYNAGEAKIRRALARYEANDFWSISQARQSYLKQETKQYVPKMIAAALIAKDPQKYGFEDIEYHPPLAYDEVKVHSGTSLSMAAGLAGCSSRELAELNPELRRWCTPPDGSMYSLKIPKGRLASFQRAYANLPAQARKAKVDSASVTVRPGDTMKSIAMMHGVKLSDLMALNSNLDPKRLKVGQKVYMPYGEDEDKPEKRVATKKLPATPRTYAPERKNSRKIIHVVKKGDSLWHVAQAYNLSDGDIRRWNGMRSNKLQPGERLVLYVPQAKVESKVQNAPSGKNVAPVGDKLVHQVAKGETLWDIARAYGVSYQDLKRWNGKRSSRLKVGDNLTVYLSESSGKSESAGSKGGSSIVYLVRRGDSLWDISRRFKVSMSDIRRWNQLGSNRLNPGDRLTLYLGRAS